MPEDDGKVKPKERMSLAGDANSNEGGGKPNRRRCPTVTRRREGIAQRKYLHED